MSPGAFGRLAALVLERAPEIMFLDSSVETSCVAEAESSVARLVRVDCLAGRELMHSAMETLIDTSLVV